MAAYRADFTGGGSGGTGNRTVTVTPAVGDLCIVEVVVSVNANLTPTMSDDNSDGSTYTLIRTARKATSADTASIFVRDKLFSNTTSTIITAATGSNTSGSVVSVHVTGMSKTGAGAVRQSAIQENQASGGTPAPAFAAAALTGNLTLGMVGNATNVATLTAPVSWTEQADTGQNSPAVGLEVVTRDSGFTGTTVTWGSTSASAFCSIILELDNNPVIEEEDSFWGTFNRNVVMGIAATVLTSSILTASIGQRTVAGDAADRDAAGAPDPIATEIYWQNPVPPIDRKLYQPLPYLPDVQDDPAGALLNAPGTTEDYWQIVQDQLPFKQYRFIEKEDQIVPQPPNAGPVEDYWGTPGSVAPPDLYPETLFLPFPLGAYGSDATTGAPPSVEEDVWQVVQDIRPYRQMPYVLGGNEDVAYPLVGNYEDDSDWKSLLAPPWPVQATNYQRLPYLPDPEEQVMDFPVTGIPDEDYWVNPVVPVVAANRVSLPLIPDPEEIPAGFLHGCMEEIFWVSGVVPKFQVHYQRLPILPDRDEPEFSFIITDEDYWALPVPTLVTQATMGKMYFWDEGEIALLVTLVEDADYWQQLVFPVTARMYQRLPLLADVAADQYVFFGEMQVTSISAEPLVLMDISAEPLVEMSIKMLKWTHWDD